MLRAKPVIASPSAVSETEWVSRATSVRPTCCSRRRMCWLTVGCWMPRRASPGPERVVDAGARPGVADLQPDAWLGRGRGDDGPAVPADPAAGAADGGGRRPGPQAAHLAGDAVAERHRRRRAGPDDPG